jgi:hypothetical protein
MRDAELYRSLLGLIKPRALTATHGQVFDPSRVPSVPATRCPREPTKLLANAESLHWDLDAAPSFAQRCHDVLTVPGAGENDDSVSVLADAPELLNHFCPPPSPRRGRHVVKGHVVGRDDRLRPEEPVRPG